MERARFREGAAVKWPVAGPANVTVSPGQVDATEDSCHLA